MILWYADRSEKIQRIYVFIIVQLTNMYLEGKNQNHVCLTVRISIDGNMCPIMSYSYPSHYARNNMWLLISWYPFCNLCFCGLCLCVQWSIIDFTREFLLLILTRVHWCLSDLLTISVYIGSTKSKHLAISAKSLVASCFLSFST
jgi:hypothetical protein